MSIDPGGQVVNFDVGIYKGGVNDQGIPHGHGRLDYKEDDALSRKYYEGQWSLGKNTGQGKMIFESGDVYEGQFDEGIPHGQGQFTYASGDVETAEWDKGQRHGLSRYVGTADNTVEEAMFWEGVAEGPATLRDADGSVEEFQYNLGLRDGQATRRLGGGEILRFTYVQNEINGEATLTRPDGSQEVLHFNQGSKHGQAEEHFKDGSREIHTYVDGVLEGPAILYGSNEDKVEFSYENGKKFGAMTYTFSDGCVERSFFNESGIQSGPTQFTWPNGAKREGHKINGKWEGQAFYLYAEGPRKGKRDVETWNNGEMVSSQKYYGEGEAITIQNWDDLKKLEVLGEENSSPDNEVYYDCISNNE